MGSYRSRRRSREWRPWPKLKRRLVDGVKEILGGVQRIRWEIEHIDRQVKAKTHRRITAEEERRSRRRRRAILDGM